MIPGFFAAGAGTAAWTPADLFANGEEGAWYDPSDLSTLYQDAAGTTPVTEVGQPVGLMLDKSGNGNHASQPTTTARPLLQRDANGKLHLAFDGVDDMLLFPGVNDITELYDAASRSGNALVLREHPSIVAYAGAVQDGSPAVPHTASGTPVYSVNGGPSVLTRGGLAAAWSEGSPAVVSIRGLDLSMYATPATGFYTNYSGYRAMYGRVLSASALSEMQRTAVRTFLAHQAGVTLGNPIE